MPSCRAAEESGSRSERLRSLLSSIRWKRHIAPYSDLRNTTADVGPGKYSAAGEIEAMVPVQNDAPWCELSVLLCRCRWVWEDGHRILKQSAMTQKVGSLTMGVEWPMFAVISTGCLEKQKHREMLLGSNRRRRWTTLITRRVRSIEESGNTTRLLQTQNRSSS